MRFYNFKFEVSFFKRAAIKSHYSVGRVEQFTYDGASYEVNDDKFIIYTKFVDDKYDSLITPLKDTLECSNEKLDMLYAQLISMLLPYPETNIADDSQELTFPEDEFGYCEIILNLIDRGGDIHRVKTQNYSSLINLLKMNF